MMNFAERWERMVGGESNKVLPLSRKPKRIGICFADCSVCHLVETVYRVAQFSHVQMSRSLWALRIRKLGFSIMTVVPGGTEYVNQTLEPITESLPITVLPPNIVALA